TFESDPVVLWCTFCRSYYMGLFLLLLYKNQRRYRRLSEDHKISCGTLTMHYTLSIRFQLNENLRSMKLLRNIIIMCGLLNILGLILYTGVRIKWLHFYSDIVAHYYDAFFNITLAV
ncbi:hypothetical protein NECAME_18252, partial [Necator americanus]